MILLSPTLYAHVCIMVILWLFGAERHASVCCSYVRAEVLAGFVNGLFLIFTAFFIFSEGVEVGALINHTHTHTLCQ